MKIIDLFAGCGGLATGFRSAGFEIALAIEKDPSAVATYMANHLGTIVHNIDIRDMVDVSRFIEGPIDGVVGGPPCQGFSLCGNRDARDPRNSLFHDFARIVEQTTPQFFVMENVTGITSMQTASGERVLDIIVSEFKRMGYDVSCRTLLAADYGVPQMRRRVIFIGVRGGDSQRMFPEAKLSPEEYVTLDDAISDLECVVVPRGSESAPYVGPPESRYQEMMRVGSSVVHNHIPMKHTQRLVERFKVIRQGQSISDVPREHAQRRRGNAREVSGKSFSQNNMRPFGNRPAPTLPAGFQSNFIHPHLHRNFTAREGARIQSFPDTYIFKGKRTNMSWDKELSQYHQIGNAVPPLMAQAIAESIATKLPKIR